MDQILKYVMGTLPSFIFRYDSYKNEDGDGLFIRFISVLLKELDLNVIPYLDYALMDQHVPRDLELGSNRTDTRMIPFLASDLGSFPNFTTTEEGFRILLDNIQRFFKLKGTQAGLDAMFIPLGYYSSFDISYQSNYVAHDLDGIDHDSELNDLDIIHDSGCDYCLSGTLILQAIPNAEPEPLVISEVSNILPLILPIYIRTELTTVIILTGTPLETLQTTEDGGPEDVYDIDGELIQHLPE